MRSDDAALAHRRTAKDACLGADPDVPPNAHRRLGDALVLDRSGDVGEYVVEVADVDPVGDDRGRAELDVEVAVDGVVVAEDALVTDAQVALVAPDGVAVADVHPSADHHPAVARPGVDLDVATQEHEPLGHDVRVAPAKDKEPPVAEEVPRRPGLVLDHPAQAGHGQVPRLPGVTVASVHEIRRYRPSPRPLPTSSASPTPLSRFGLQFGRNGALAWVKRRQFPASPSRLSRTARPDLWTTHLAAADESDDDPQDLFQRGHTLAHLLHPVGAQRHHAFLSVSYT